MSVLDLKTELNRMIEEREGVSDNTSEYKIYKDLDSLKTSLQEMIEIRSGNMRLNRRSCETHQATICTGHNYHSYRDILRDSLSIGDIDKAIDLLTYCTCNARQAPSCLCQQNQKKDHCMCHTRSTLFCSCQNRDGGKYGPRCDCNSRTTVPCNCHGRTATLNCTCDGRCACNVQKEFSPIPMDRNCACNTKVVEGCTCNTVASKECVYHECSCVMRSTAPYTVLDCSCNGYAPRHGFGCRRHKKGCVCEAYSGPCPENYTAIIGLTQCEKVYNDVLHDISTCQCMSRCACNTKAVMK